MSEEIYSPLDLGPKSVELTAGPARNPGSKVALRPENFLSSKTLRQIRNRFPLASGPGKH